MLSLAVGCTFTQWVNSLEEEDDDDGGSPILINGESQASQSVNGSWTPCGLPFIKPLPIGLYR